MTRHILAAIAFVLTVAGLSAQTPQTQPLVQIGDVEYRGSFLAPFQWGGRPLSLADGGKSLWYGCPGGDRIAKLTIPASGATATAGPCQSMPNMAAVKPGDPNGYRFGGLLEVNGKLLATAYPTYDADGGQAFSHFVGDALSAMQGPYKVSTDLQGRVAGTMTPIPTEWRTLFGGSHLTGLCCVSILFRTSLGPSAYVFTPSDVGVVNPVPAKPILMYPIEHPLGRPYTAPGGAEGVVGLADPYYSALTMYPGAAFPAGTRSVLFIGRHADTICYGTPPACGGDPTSVDKGNHASAYYYVMAAYDANDLLAVKNGTRSSWEPRPYGFWKIPGSRPDVTIQGVAFDPTTNMLYVSEENNRLVHQWHIKAPGAIEPPPTPTATVTVNAAVTHQTMRGWEVTAQADQYLPGFAGYASAALDRVVEAGHNRVRLEVRSGSENTVDSFGLWKAAGYPEDGGAAHQAWRATRYTLVNDNADPNTAAAGRFHWSELDNVVDELVNPLRARLAAKGESLYVNLTLVSFYNGQTNPNILQQPAEYAEFMLEAFKHLQSKYGWVPNAIGTVLEPDNTVNWGGAVMGQVIAAAGTRLQAAGFTPAFSAPSTTSMGAAATWFDALWAVTGARPFLKELSYHRYTGVSTAALQSIASKAQAAGISTAMLECWPIAGCANDFRTLHEDLTTGRNSAWQQSVFVDKANPGGFAVSHVPPSAPTTAVLTTPTQFLRQYFTAARMGAQRVGATSTATLLAPLAFRNTDGRFSVVVKATAAATFGVAGLPAGTYGITYTASSTSSAAVADRVGSHPDQTITAGQPLVTSIPAWGVLTVIGKAAGPPPPPPDVNCVETPGTWGPGGPPEFWSACVGTSQFRDRVWTTTVAKSGNGQACTFTGSGAVGSTFTEHQTQACTPTPPPAAATVTLTHPGAPTVVCTQTATGWACK